MSAHIHAALMALYAQDAAETDKPWERWQLSYPDGSWRDIERGFIFAEDMQYRRKPRTHVVNGIEVPAPMKDAPAIGAEYFIADPTHDKWFASPNWCDDLIDARWLERGLVHATKEAAVANAMAMIGRKS